MLRVVGACCLAYGLLTGCAVAQDQAAVQLSLDTSEADQALQILRKQNTPASLRTPNGSGSSAPYPTSGSRRVKRASVRRLPTNSFKHFSCRRHLWECKASGKKRSRR